MTNTTTTKMREQRDFILDESSNSADLSNLKKLISLNKPSVSDVNEEVATLIRSCCTSNDSTLIVRNLLKLSEDLLKVPMVSHATYVSLKAAEICNDNDLLIRATTFILEHNKNNSKIISNLVKILQQKSALDFILQNKQVSPHASQIIACLCESMSDKDHTQGASNQVESNGEELKKVESNLPPESTYLDMVTQFNKRCKLYQDQVDIRGTIQFDADKVTEDGQVDCKDVVLFVISLDPIKNIVATSHASLGYIQVWDMDQKKLLKKLGEGLTGMHMIWELCNIGSRSLLVAASPDSTNMNVFNHQTGELVNIIECDSPISTFGHRKMFSFDKYFGVGLQDGSVAVYDATINKGKLMLKLEGHRDWVFSTELAPHGRLLTGTLGQISVWNLGKKYKEYIIEAHTGYVTSLVLIDNERFLSASSEGVLKMWDLKTRCCMSIMQAPGNHPIYQVSMIAMNFVVTANEDGMVRYWDLKDGVERKHFQEHRRRPSNCLLNNSNRQQLMVGSADRKLRVFGSRYQSDRS
ncbi:hypothetical protein AKO1_009541 [Acrasis kona]|uniref:WD repeat-containing protein 55 homolog n=1 Tax=Acrasis kona TaxID=1008807 RepID=A0AAW2ZM15_9EUKA